MTSTNKEQKIQKILYDLAVEFGYGHYSTLEEIDYKFWEDVPAKDIAQALAEQIIDNNDR